MRVQIIETRNVEQCCYSHHSHCSQEQCHVSAMPMVTWQIDADEGGAREGTGADEEGAAGQGENRERTGASR